MRVLIVNKFAHVTGGVDRHCLDLATALRGAGHEVAFLSTRSAANRERGGAFVPAAATAADRGSLGFGGAQRAARRALWNATAAAAAERLLDDFAPDVVHVHKLYPQLSVSPVRVAVRCGVPVVQTVHDYELAGPDPLGGAGSPAPPERALAAALHAIRRRWHVPAVATFVAATDYVARVYARAGIAAEVVPLPTVAPPGPEPPFAARRGAVFAGRFAVEKGVLDVLDVARRAPELPITIAGDGPLAPLVRERAQGLPNVGVDAGMDPARVWRLLRGARLLVAPSRWAEPAGLVALEAMAVGTPVVAYDVGGLGEEVRRSGGGVVVEPDPGALADACAELAGDESRWSEHSAAGRRHVTREHAPAAYVERLVAIYAAA